MGRSTYRLLVWYTSIQKAEVQGSSPENSISSNVIHFSLESECGRAKWAEGQRVGWIQGERVRAGRDRSAYTCRAKVIEWVQYLDTEKVKKIAPQGGWDNKAVLCTRALVNPFVKL